MKHFVLPTLVNLREIEKFHMKRKLNQEEIDARLRSMTPEARLRKGPALSTVEIPAFYWRLRQAKTPIKPQLSLDSKILEEVLGKNVDWGHLNNRRQVTRLERIARDIKWARQLQDVKVQRVVENARESEIAQATHTLRIKAEEALALEATKLKELPAPSTSTGSS
jgi:hypothetical protein